LCGIVFVFLSNNVHISAYEFSPRDESPFAGGIAAVNDSQLKDHRDYQRWKKAFLNTQAGRSLWGADHLTVYIRMGENSAGPRGAETKDFVFDTAGNLREATIVFGPEFGKYAPTNKADYPVLVSLAPDYEINREVRFVAGLAHEFGHIHHVRRLGGKVFQRQNELLDENEAGFFKYGTEWFQQPYYKEIVTKLGCAPANVGRQREIEAEAFVIPVIVDYFAGKPPLTVRQAIQNYRTEYPLALAITDTQRTLASDLDAQLPKLSFGDWFAKVVGPEAGVIWQLGECGERGEESLKATGDIPACVEANAMLPDGRRVILLTTVGTFKKGVTGPPSFRFGVIDQRGELYLVRRLRDLQKQLLSPKGLANRPALKLPEVSTPQVNLSANNKYVDLAPAWGRDAFGQAIEDPPPAPRRPGPPLSRATSDAENQDAFEDPGRPAGGEVKLLGDVAWGDVIKKSQPRYPAQAKRVNAAGPVNVQITISETGRVIQAKATSGHPLLREAAVEAARQWLFKPAILDGHPVKTETVLVFVFTVPK
jgi:TonB family protein